MELNAKSVDRKLLVELSGDLDHHGAREAIRQLELAIDAALPGSLCWTWLEWALWTAPALL